MNLIKSAIGGISDKHITEFAFVTPKRGRIKLLAKIASAAACVAVAVAAVPMIGRTISSLPAFSNGLDLSEPSQSIIDDFPEQYYQYTPHVRINGKVYMMYFLPGELDKLSDSYEVIGEVLSVDSLDSDKDGYAKLCNVGELIFQDPDLPGEIFVYTTLYDDEGYHYIRFLDLETYEHEYFLTGRYHIFINDRWYKRSFNDTLSELPEGYVLIDTITSLDQYDFDDFYEEDNTWLDIGDKIYQNPDFPGEFYIYSRLLEKKEYFYWRFIDIETIKLEGKSEGYLYPPSIESALGVSYQDLMRGVGI